ncbi:MAG: hypothetical protein WBA57_09170 [Elainellaceae cyanobacterium]
MQLVLNVLFDTTCLVGGSYVSVGFVMGLVNLWHKSHPDVKATQAEVLTALPAATATELGEKLEMPNLEQIREHEAIALENFSQNE